MTRKNFHHLLPGIALATACLLSASTVFAQIDDDYEPIPPAKPSQGKIGGAGGYTPGWLYMDLTTLNQYIASAEGMPFDDAGLFMQGGQGYAYILLLQNFRIGGMGMSGSRSSTRIEGSVRRNIEIGAGYGGVTLEYAWPVIPRLDVTAGLLLGGGSMSIAMRRDQGSFREWGGVWQEYGGTAPVAEYSTLLEGSFFVYQPSITLEFALLRWIGLRAGATYLGTTGASWTLDGDYELHNVPAEVRPDGWMISTGIYLGTFIY